MHLIVHLRRNAPVPTQIPEIPPPALLPKVWRHETPVRAESGSPVSPTKSEKSVKEDEATVRVKKKRMMLRTMQPNILLWWKSLFLKSGIAFSLQFCHIQEVIRLNLNAPLIT